MSAIHGVGGNNPVHKVSTPPGSRRAETAQPSSANRPADRLELSGVGHLLKTLKAAGDVRVDKVAAIKQQIEAGTYEDEAKIDATVERLLDELAK